MTSVRKILILAGDIDGNLGDAAIVLSTCENLVRLDKRLDIVLISDRSILNGKCSRIHVIPKGLKGLIRLLARARESDLVLCGGGGLFQDDDSLIKMPYWAFRLILVRMFCRRIIGYSLGVGPLRFAASRFFAGLAFACMEQFSVRDPLSQATTREAIGKNATLVPDPALMLTAGSRKKAAALLKRFGVPLDGTPLVGVALRRWFHHTTTLIPHKYIVKYGLRKIRGQQQCRKMVILTAEVLDRLATDHGAFFVFLPTYNVSHEADADICQQVMEEMASPRKAILAVHDPRQYKAIASFLSALLGGRMHPTILAAGEDVPVVGLSYNQKFTGFFQLLGCPDSLIQVEDFVNNERTQRLYELLASALTAKAGPGTKVRDLKALTDRFNRSILFGNTP
jgi:polysaccharide pyruvyl transferase WcaK-like protein